VAPASPQKARARKAGVSIVSDAKIRHPFTVAKTVSSPSVFFFFFFFFLENISSGIGILKHGVIVPWLKYFINHESCEEAITPFPLNQSTCSSPYP
jgi:hypothetical protein